MLKSPGPRQRPQREDYSRKTQYFPSW